MPRVARDISLFTKAEIQALLKNSRVIYRHPGLDIRAAKASHAFGKILIITPKKMGNAPERNRIRRRLKAIFYEEKLYNYCYDIAIFCKKEANSLSFFQLKAIITDSIKSLSN